MYKIIRLYWIYFYQLTELVHWLEQNAEIVKFAVPGGIISSGVVGVDNTRAAARCLGGVLEYENCIPESSTTPAG